MHQENIFSLHSDIMKAYKSYINSFINIADSRIRERVEEEFESASLYPEPLIQFNPSFENGGTISDLVSKGILDSNFNDIFYDNAGNPWSIYKHQLDAIKKGNEDKPFVVTSGTGSGKSLTYISTIFNYLFKNPDQTGIKAIIVYPLNALINSQEASLKEFEENYKKRTGQDFPFTYARFTGQEKQDERERLKSSPPDILLTNYMMLELFMIRKEDESIRNSFKENLRYLVFDELHVYRGRQGADVSMLIRRIKSSVNNKKIICIGTSATMTTGSIPEQKKEVAKVARRFFNLSNEELTSENIIVESLAYSTIGTQPDVSELTRALEQNPENLPWDKIVKNPLARWLERSVAIMEEENYRRRNKPLSLSKISEQLSNLTGRGREICAKQIVTLLVRAEQLNIENTRQKKRETLLPFKLHQFISQTGYVYITLDSADIRYITLDPNPYVKLPESEKDVPVFQTVFSRLSGVEFICVRKNFDEDKLEFRDFNDNENPRNEDDLKVNNKKVKKRKQEDYTDGYLLLDENYKERVEDYLELLPSAWKDKNSDIIKQQKDFLLPKLIYVQRDGTFSESPMDGIKAWFVPAPLKYDPTCGQLYLESKLSEKTKLISLGNEGRSTSTTILTLHTLLALFNQGRPLAEQKLMSFTDNRQDASLQAGHFNDFIQVVHLRSAIEKVLRSAAGPLTIFDLIYKVEDELNLTESDYAINPSTNPQIPSENNKKALRHYITYRIIQDIKRGWRYILPNLEQTALMEIDYQKLDEYAKDDSLWEHQNLLDSFSADKRKSFVLQILNFFRNSYAVDVDMLRYENRHRIQDELNNVLNKEKLWSLDKGENLEAPAWLSLDGADKASRETYINSIGSASRLGRFVKHEFRRYTGQAPNNQEYKEFMESLLQLLVDMHYLRADLIHAKKGDTTAYQLNLGEVLWSKGDEVNVVPDKTSLITVNETVTAKPHRYFQQLYKRDFSKLPKQYVAAEHTGQIPNEQKIDRENKFNDAKELSALYCSPTMELGIDISSLNIVHMRNVPPNPANYAQRSGRAGRSGQSALVFTYASKVSPHDKHYFADPVKMVSGVVQAPRIELANEELIRSHINATVLSFLNAEEIKPSIIDLVDIPSRDTFLKKDLKIKYQEIIDLRFGEIKALVYELVRSIDGIRETHWFTDDWLDAEIKNVPGKLDGSLRRWKEMWLDAKKQMDEAHEIKTSPILKDQKKKDLASRSYFLAGDRLGLLKNEGSGNSQLSEFYTFRYLAAEGFLPGYNFTRLPIRVFLGGGKDRKEAVSRARFVGLREFGPSNVIYYNGGKYKVNRVSPSDVAMNLSSIRISKGTGYAFLDEEGNGVNADPITGTSFDASNLELIHQRLLELQEAQSERTERISCMEEIRSSEGYGIDTFLNSHDNLRDATKIKLTVDGQELMRLFYAPAAKLIMLNRQWKRAKEKDAGFLVGEKSGFFKTLKESEKPSPDDPIKNIMLYTYDTSDILYIQPIKSLTLSEEGVITMQFALEKAIEQIYNIESTEIAAVLMGSEENKNIMLYESAEGSIGVLKDISRNPAILRDIFKKAYEICGYDYDTKSDRFPDRTKATYEDLLSYYNQIYHSIIDRHSIIKALELLILSNPDDTQHGTYEGHYETLKNGLNHQSPGELELLYYLFDNGYRLPDYTNFNLNDFYIQPDFVYEKEKALIFVDGGIHKNAVVRADDERKRKLLEQAGYDVLVWDYTSENITSFVTRRQDVFRKVR